MYKKLQITFFKIQTISAYFIFTVVITRTGCTVLIWQETGLHSIIGPSLPETANEDSIREVRSIRVSATEAHTTRHDTTDCRHWMLSSTACDISISTFADLHFIFRIIFTCCFRFKPAHPVSLPPYMAIRDSLSGTVVKLRTGRQYNSGSIPDRSVRFSILGILHTGCVGQPASTLMDTGILCPG